MALLLVALLWRAPAIQAIELSHYFGGFANMNDYFLPPSEAGEFLYGQYNVYYHSDTIRDHKGKKIDSITVAGPLGNTRSIQLDVKVDQIFLAPAFMWAPKWNVLGGRYGAYLVVPVGNPSLEANLETERGRGTHASTSVWDVGDVFFQPIWMLWSFGRDGRRPPIDVGFGYGFNAPAGRYHAGAADNVGLGFWEHQIQLSQRFRLDEATDTTFVTAHTFEIAHEKEGVEVTPGAHYTLNWAFGRHFFEHWLETALLGYDTFQIADDTGSAVSADSRVRDQVHAVGVQLGVPNLGIAFKYYHEFGARDRFEGDLYTLSFGLPLDRILKSVGGW